MAIRRRTVLWVVLGLLLLPIVVAAGLVALLVWWPTAPRPLSQIVGPPAEGSAALGRQVTLRVVGLPPARKLRSRHFRVDNAHSNVYAAWQAMGKPDWPNAAQLAELHRRDELQRFEPERQVTTDATGAFEMDFELPMPALSLIELLPAEKR